MGMAKGLLITTDNTFTVIDDVKGSTVGEIISARHGLFDIVAPVNTPFAENCIFFIDDEGLLVDEPQPNLFASLLTQRIIAGDVVLVGDEDEDGNLTDIPELLTSPEFAEEFQEFVIKTPMLREALVQRMETMDLSPRIMSMDEWLAEQKAHLN